MFTHLHTHTEYSLLDGLSKIPALLDRARNMGQGALAITDHGAMYGAIEFYEEARAREINPILGLEGYVASGSRFERNPKERSPFHLTMLAQNETGYRNLLKLSSASHLEGFYYRPRMDRELLAAHSEGLIVLSACPSGELMGALADGREQDALEAASWYRDVFPGRYYIELQEHGQEEFSRLNPALVDVARKLDLPLVVTNDSHYTDPEQHHVHDVLLCVGTNSTVHETNRMRMESETFYLRSEEEMRSLFPELPEAADNTALIAEQVDIRLEFGRTLLPDPGVPEGMTPAAYLRDLCERGLQERYGSPTEDQRERLRYELHVIEETGFLEYILIVRDIAHFARDRKIPMGVRGSAAASIVLYCLGVTDIEPTQYRLVFERFLNLERREMPDVDFDFADDRREEVIRYTAERYGHDRVAQIITFGTLGAKAAIRDTGRALGMNYGDVDRIARLIPNALHVNIDQALDEVPEMQQRYEDEQEVRQLIDTARGMEGVARHASTHAAGIVISREPLTEVVPLQRATSSKGDDETALPTTQYAMNEVAKIGLLKMDYLGLSNLTILGRAADLISERQGEPFDLASIPDADEQTAEMLARGETFGVFQLESAGMRRYVAELQPRDIRELAAMIALYRPGPMEHIPRYIEVKHGRAEPHYPHQDLASVLDETYGVITYQDQVLEIARTFAGYTLGTADIMRKAMGKKIPAVMLAERERFLEGAVAKGYEQRLAEQVFDLIEPFAGYAFNKAHAFSYAVIAYRTAYLKAHYPVEYLTAVLQAAGAHPTGAQDRIAAAAAESSRLGVPVLQPDVNRSQVNFAIERLDNGADGIRFGLAQVKNVGVGAVEGLIAVREEDGPFKSIEDFARRVDPRDLNRRVLESLAKAGALDGLAERSAVVFGVERIVTVAQEALRQRETGQTSMFDLFGDEVDTPLPALELESVETPHRELLLWERELLGTYVSDHPFRRAVRHLDPFTTVLNAEVGADLAGQQAVVAGTVQTVRKLTTRQGKPFAAVALEDLSGVAELTMWPDSYEQHSALLTPGNVLLALIDVRERGERLTLAIEEIVACDADTGLPTGFNPMRFQPRVGPRTYGRRKQPAAALPPPFRASDLERQSPDGQPERARLEAVPSDVPPSNGMSNGASNGVSQTPRATPRPAARRDGPPRLLVSIEETTDTGADRRRLAKLWRLLESAPGDRLAELEIRTRGGQTELLRLPGIGDIDRLLPQIRALFGVLGGADWIGEQVANERPAELAAAR